MANRRHLFKVLILGDASVGKTSLLQRYVKDSFREGYKATIGADFLTKEVVIEGQLATLQIWDTAGQDRFETLGRVFYRGTDACIFVYDVTNPKSLENLARWKELYLDAQAGASSETVFAVMGNKADMEEKRVISQKRAEEWCQAHGNMAHYLVSAKDGRNVEQAFAVITKETLELGRHWEPALPDVDDHILRDFPADGYPGKLVCC